jgi:hypothetical protein
VALAFGGNAWFLLIGDEPCDVIIDHNTVAHEGTSFIYVYGGTAASPRPVRGAAITNNLARHNTYGIAGAYFAYGNAVLQNYFPSVTFAANYLAGAPVSRYPSTLLRGSEFDLLFADAAAGDFRLREDSVLRGAASDGTDVGADVAAVMTTVRNAGPGAVVAPRLAPPSQLRIVR